MKIIFIASSFLFTAGITPLLAQAKVKEEAAAAKIDRDANSIAFEALEHVKSIFTTATTATNEEKATAAATAVKEITAKIVALQTVLKATPMPTVEEKKAFAQKMLQYEPLVSVIIKKMTNTFHTNSEEVNKLIQPAMTSFQEKIKPTMTLINIYYPKEEMTGYIDELKGK